MKTLSLWLRALACLLATLLLVACHYQTRTLAQAMLVGILMFCSFVALGASLLQAVRDAWGRNSIVGRSAALLLGAVVYVAVALVFALETTLGGAAQEALCILIEYYPPDSVPSLDGFIYRAAEPTSTKTVNDFTSKTNENGRYEEEGFEHPQWGFVRHGRARSWTKEGVLTWKAQYRYGKLEGPATEVWPDGNVRSVLLYSNGKPGNECTYFFPDGAVAAVIPLRDGKPQAAGRFFSPDGKVISAAEHVQRYQVMFK